MRAYQAQIHTVAEKQNKLNKHGWARKAQSTALTDHLQIWQAEAVVHVHWNTYTTSWMVWENKYYFACRWSDKVWQVALGEIECTHTRDRCKGLQEVCEETGEQKKTSFSIPVTRSAADGAEEVQISHWISCALNFSPPSQKSVLHTYRGKTNCDLIIYNII